MLSCFKEKTDECNYSPIITEKIMPSQPCVATGSIELFHPVEANLQYQIDGQAFQSETLFSNLEVGRHILVIKQANGCEEVKEFTIDTAEQGPEFKQVQSILSHRCSKCHSGNNPQAGLNFTEHCDILSHWSRIESRAVEGVPTAMPQEGLIPWEERKVIVTWIKNGHAYNN